MQISFLTVFTAVLALAVLAVPGFLLAKFKMLPESAGGVISTIVLYGSQPVMVFMSFQTQFRPDVALNMLYVAILSLIIHIAMFGIISLVIRDRQKWYQRF